MTDCIVRASGDIQDLPDKIKDDLEPVRAQISKSFQSLHETYSATSTGLVCSDTQQSFGKVAALVTSSEQAELAVNWRIRKETATAKDAEEVKRLLDGHLRRRQADANPSKPSESRTVHIHSRHTSNEYSYSASPSFAI